MLRHRCRTYNIYSMSSTSRARLSIRQAIIQASPRSSQSCNGFLAASFISALDHTQVRTIKEASGDMTGAMSDMAKSAVTSAVETGQSAMESAGVKGEKGMHTADRAVDSENKTTKNISDRMIGEAEDRITQEYEESCHRSAVNRK